MKSKFGLMMVILAIVLLVAAIACGSSATAPLPTQPPPSESPITGNPPPEEPLTTEVPAPIEDAAVVPPATSGGEYVLNITSGLPSGCAEFNGYEVNRDGNRFLVDVTNLMPDPSEPIACTEIYGYHDSEVALGSDLEAGEAYTISINEDFTITFTAAEADGTAMAEKESPIEGIEVTELDGDYLLTIISRLPKGSSCSKFYSYTVNERFDERIEVTVSHLEVTADNVPCTADLPVVVTEIPLSAAFAEGKTYTVSVNGTEATFPEEGTATIVVPAPIEEAKVVAPEQIYGEYILKVTSGLPSGCARFDGYEVERDGNHFSVSVTNRMPDPDEPIACTAIYGYHEEEITLGSGLTPARPTPSQLMESCPLPSAPWTRRVWAWSKKNPPSRILRLQKPTADTF